MAGGIAGSSISLADAESVVGNGIPGPAGVESAPGALCRVGFGAGGGTPCPHVGKREAAGCLEDAAGSQQKGYYSATFYAGSQAAAGMEQLFAYMRGAQRPVTVAKQLARLAKHRLKH